jgi:ribosome recycling factor
MVGPSALRRTTIMMDEVMQDLEEAIKKAREALKRELSKLRTGRAHPAMLDGLRVDYYGQPTPIAQMAAVSVPEPRMLVVKPWEKNQAQAIDKAIRDGDLGLNPQLDGDVIRVPVPPLSEERRKDLVKLAKKSGEDCKVAIRKARHDTLDLLAEMKQSGDASEDDVERAKKKVEELITAAGQDVDTIVQAKEKEILVV